MYAVTGGTGFLGDALVRRLSAKGATVTVAARAPPPPAAPATPGVRYVRGDVLDRESLARAFEGAQGVFHLAGVVEHSSKGAARERMRSVHVDGTLNTLEAAKEAGVRRVVYASTSGTVAVSSTGTVPYPNDASPYATDITATWPYYATKIEAENAALQRAEKLGIELVTLRPSLLLGPGDDRLSSCRSVYDALRGRLPLIPNGGIAYVDVRDAADAFLAAMDGAGRPGATYLLGAHNTTLHRFFADIQRLSGVPGPRFALPNALATLGGILIDGALAAVGRHDPTFDPVFVAMSQAFWYCDGAAAAAELGVQFRPADETLRDTIDWLQKNKK